MNKPDVEIKITISQPVFFDREETMNRFVEMILERIDKQSKHSATHCNIL